jgi:2-polyprenyl-6-methoxyphenol hydroxylase-like FAD-dependent oxidoreductase
MAGKVVIVGAGPIGLATALLLARDGHDVTVLEKDSQAPPATGPEAWAQWQRSGVAQFRQLHFMHARFRHLLDAEFPEVRDRIEALGGRRFNMITALPRSLSDRSFRQGDERFETITARRPILECAFAQVAEATNGVQIIRGVGVQGLTTGRSVRQGIPHVTGVRTIDGTGIPADLVIDSMGRRSKLGEWIAAIGGQTPYEEASDVGFAYYTRYYQSRDGSLPEYRGPLNTTIGSLLIVTVWADNNTWAVVVAAMAGDQPLKALRHNGVWERVTRSFPHVAHWIDGDPICDVLPMAGVLDRYRRIVVSNQPVVTGLLPVGDAWACTNPTAGRGFSMGLMHAIALRDTLREHPDDSAKLAEAFDRVTEETLTPWYRDQNERDAQRAEEIRAAIDGRTLDRSHDSPTRQMQMAFLAAASADPDVARASFEVISCLALPSEVMNHPGIREKVTGFVGVQPPQVPGPSRAELVALMQ